MTDEELAAIRTRAEAATPGPWAMSRDEMSAGFGQHRYVVVGTTTADGKKLVDWRLLVEGMRGADAVHDAAFIAAARTDVPALLAEVDRLRALLRPAMEELEAANSLADILPELRAVLGEPG